MDGEMEKGEKKVKADKKGSELAGESSNSSGVVHDSGKTMESEAALGATVEEVEEDDTADFNPMSRDYQADIGLTQGDPIISSTDQVFKETRFKDVPCRFHDGFSGTCWKGSMCPYGHQRYTGGRFASKEPELAFAAGASREATTVLRLPRKPLLHNEREIVCRVTHVVSPGEFFIRPTTDGTLCPCTIFDAMVQAVENQKNQGHRQEDSNDPMEAYYYGFSGIEAPEGLAGNEVAEIFVPPTLDEKLQSFLSNALYYNKLQSQCYIPKVELVAACVNKKWMRAIVLVCLPKENLQAESNIRVQLLDTGEKVTVSAKNVCRLPEKFCKSHVAAFRCSLFRVSPVWFIWPRFVIKFFKDLVENKEVRVIVKDSTAQQEDEVGIFEQEPYSVKVMIDEKGDGKWTDVAQKIIDEGYGLEWNLMPFRPFAGKDIKTEGFDFLYTPGQKLPPQSALELENKRLLWNTDKGEEKKLPEIGDFIHSTDLSDEELCQLVFENEIKKVCEWLGENNLGQHYILSHYEVANPRNTGSLDEGLGWLTKKLRKFQLDNDSKKDQAETESLELGREGTICLKNIGYGCSCPQNM